LSNGFLQHDLVGSGVEGIIGNDVEGDCLPNEDLPEKHPDRSCGVQACRREEAVGVLLDIQAQVNETRMRPFWL
jgi:hypothetical protein